MFFNAVTSLLMLIHLCRVQLVVQRQAEDRGTGPRACWHLFWCIIVYRVPSIISTSKSMALHHRRDSMPCNPRGRMKGELNPMDKRCVTQSERERKREQGGKWRRAEECEVSRSDRFCSSLLFCRPPITLRLLRWRCRTHCPAISTYIPSRRSHPYEEPAYLLQEPEAAHTPFTVPPVFLLLLSELVKRRPLIQLAW